MVKNKSLSGQFQPIYLKVSHLQGMQVIFKDKSWIMFLPQLSSFQSIASYTCIIYNISPSLNGHFNYLP